jgi:hypothetical protein
MPFDSASYPETIAAKMRDWFGPNGERWNKRWMHSPAGRACLMGAYQIATDRIVTGNADKKWMWPGLKMNRGYSLLRQACIEITGKRTVPSANDSVESFETISKILDRMHQLEIEAMVSAK